jgi:GntR family transcriptional regulator, carbon starvation induced regulator
MLDPKRVTRATLATQLEDALRVDIIEGVITPGQRLRAADLTARYGVSATPLREALQRLAAQNLVEIDPRLGATVAHISRTDLRDIYWLRELLEGLALERSIERGDEAWERRVTESWERFKAHGNKQQTGTAEDALAWSDAHRAFHEALFAACDSPWLLRFVGTLYDHSERYRMLSVRSRLRDTLEEHAGIYEPAVARNAPEAVAWLRRHLSNTVANLEQGMAVAPDGSESGEARPAPTLEGVTAPS